jgi:hypothetical protein
MADIKLAELCKTYGWNRDEVDALRKKLGIGRKKRSGAWVISAEDSNTIIKEMELPPELTSPTYYATGLHEARNPRWMMCTIDGLEGKQAVLVPKRFQFKLRKKRFPVEKIEDANGVTWRHEWFSKLEAYGR